MSPNGGGEPEGLLAEAIARDFGSFDQFKAKMSAATIAVQGSGWGWLGYNKEASRLQITTCANQDPLQVNIFFSLHNTFFAYFFCPILVFKTITKRSLTF